MPAVAGHPHHLARSIHHLRHRKGFREEDRGAGGESAVTGLVGVDAGEHDHLGTRGSAGAHARLERVDLSDARDWEWILPPVTTHYGYAMRVACRRAGFEPTVVHEVTDTAASLALAASGAGVTPVTAMMRALAPHPSVAVVTLKQDIRRYLCLAEQVRSDHRPSVQAVADIIRSVVGGDEPVGSGRAAVR